MALSYQEIINPTSNVYAVTFPYITTNDIKAVGKNNYQSSWTDLTASVVDYGASTIITGSNFTSYNKIRIYRTSTTAALVDFQKGSRLSENDLDTAYKQGLFVAQEVSENAKEQIAVQGPVGPTGPAGTNGTDGADGATLERSSGGEVVVNDNSVDCDFRVESNNNAYLFCCDGDEGKIGMGTANPITNGALYLDFSNGSGTGGSLLTLRAGGSTSSQNIIATTHTGVTDKSTTITTQRSPDGSVDMMFATAGTSSTVGSTDMIINGDNSVISGDFNDTSDVSLKENILDIPDGAITTIKSLRPRTFTWIESKDEGKDKDSGFIAQEIETVLPDDVHGENGSKGINTLGVVAHLTKALQESIAKIEALEARIITLETVEEDPA